MRRFLPIVSLLLLCPFIAEFLLGNLQLAQIGLLAPLALMYGSGALLIREIVRQMDLPPASLVLLALAYGLIEEGLVTQSLFDPDYAGHRLLDYGFLSSFGTALPWAAYVLTLHVAWSIATPIVTVEFLFRSRSQWLGRAGLVVTAAIYVCGSVFLRLATADNGFAASPLQSLSVISASTILIAAALRASSSRPRRVLSLRWYWVFVFVFLSGSSLMILQMFAGEIWRWPWVLTTLGQGAIVGGGGGSLLYLASTRRWSDSQVRAALSGALAVYVWFGLVLDSVLHPHAGEGHWLIAGAGVALIAFLSIGSGPHHHLPEPPDRA